MSAWDTGFFDDDYTEDVRDFYMEQLWDGKDHAAAMQAAEEAFQPLEESEDYHLFWGTIALLQWGRGYLTEPVRQKALNLMRSDRDAEYWSDAMPELQEKRRKVVYRLIEKLESPQGKPRGTRRPRGKRCPFATGDLLSFRLNGLDWKHFHKDGYDMTKYFEEAGIAHLSCLQGKYCLVYVAHVYKVPGLVKGTLDEAAVYGVYEWIGDHPPTLQIAEKHPLCDMQGGCFRTAMYSSKAELAFNEIAKIGHTDKPPKKMETFPEGWNEKNGSWADISRVWGETMYQLGYR